MYIIKKYQLQLLPEQRITLPRKTRLLTIKVSLEMPNLWTLEDDNEKEFMPVAIRMIEVDFPFHEHPGIHLATLQFQGGLLTFLVFVHTLLVP